MPSDDPKKTKPATSDGQEKIVSVRDTIQFALKENLFLSLTDGDYLGIF